MILLFTFLLLLTSPVSAKGTHSQAIQLERGWNLVSWYIEPEDPTPLDFYLYMDDLFANQIWFEYNQTDPKDKVGRYDRFPGQDIFFPQYGRGYDWQTGSWWWNLRQAYPIFMESTAHFWEFTEQELYDPIDPYEDFTPSEAWDDYEQIGLPQTTQTTYWFFISYPIRKQLKLRDSNTINWLFNLANNTAAIIKDDDGRCYTPLHPDNSTLEYLTPGKGYFLGYQNGTTVLDCPWFLVDEGATPESIPPDPKENQNTTCSGSHFTFKSKTHWWYPIQIDTIVVDESSPEPGDEIAVFDGNLCVGAQQFEGQYPFFIAAWMDDIATLDIVDGYIVDEPMTFVWYDVSENREITFEQPPQIMANQPEVDPYIPTHSGFGKGLYAVRSLNYGVQSITQLPQEYKVCQNYPNPFNAETIIPIELPQRSQIKIELFNILGKNLGVIYEGITNAGWVRIRYNARNLPSGVYFYHISAEGLERGGKFQDVRKMLLLK